MITFARAPRLLLAVLPVLVALLLGAPAAQAITVIEPNIGAELGTPATGAKLKAFTKPTFTFSTAPNSNGSGVQKATITIERKQGKFWVEEDKGDGTFGATNAENTSYARTAPLTAGSYRWRLTSTDTTTESAASYSEWRTFTVTPGILFRTVGLTKANGLSTFIRYRTNVVGLRASWVVTANGVKVLAGSQVNRPTAGKMLATYYGRSGKVTCKICVANRAAGRTTVVRLTLTIRGVGAKPLVKFARLTL